MNAGNLYRTKDGKIFIIINKFKILLDEKNIPYYQEAGYVFKNYYNDKNYDDI